MKKRILALALAMCMLVGLLPATALAEEEEAPPSLNDLIADPNRYSEDDALYFIRDDTVEFVLTDDLTLTSTVNIIEEASVAVNLNGFTLTADGVAAFRVDDGGSLVVRDRTRSGGTLAGTIVESMDGANGAFIIANGIYTADPTDYAAGGSVIEPTAEGYVVNENRHVITFVGYGRVYGVAAAGEDGTVERQYLPDDPGLRPLEYNFFLCWINLDTGMAVNGYWNYQGELLDEVETFTADTDVYAQYVAKAWAVNFYDGFSDEPIEVKTEEFDAFNDTGIVSVELPENPTHPDGYDFLGWQNAAIYSYDEESDSDYISGSVAFDPTAVDYNYDVYAAWAVDYTFGFKGVPNSETDTTTVVTVTVKDEDGNTVESTYTNADGYTFFNLNRAKDYTITYKMSGYTTVTRDTATSYDGGFSVNGLIDILGNGGTWTASTVLLEKAPVYNPPASTPTPSPEPSEEPTAEPTAEPTTTTTENEDGTVTETTETVETVENEDGSTTTTTTTDTTVTDAEGNVLSTTNAVVEETVTVDEDGGETVTTTTTTTTEQADGTTATTVETDGALTEASVTLPETESDEPVTLPIPELPADSTSETAATITVSTPAETETTIEIPVTDATAGTVIVLVHEDGTEEIVNTTTLSDGGVKVTVSGDVTVKVIDNTPEFGDIGEDDWHEEAVVYATARGIFNSEGTGEGNFEPEGDMTRAMVFTTLARFSGVDTEGGETWYEKGMEWAVENGVSDGTNHDGTVTREQLVTMLYRLVGEPETTGEGKTFTDSDSISDWAADAMAWAVEIGLISGYASGDVRPGNNATRAEVATIFMRFIEATAN